MDSLPHSADIIRRTGRGGFRIGAGRKPQAKPTLEQFLRFFNSAQSVEKLLDLRLRRFKLGRAEFHELLKLQKGLCAMCERPLASAWTIDHDHLSGAIRGLLHRDCNLLLGMGGEDPQRFEQAIAYIKKHNKFLR